MRNEPQTVAVMRFTSEPLVLLLIMERLHMVA